MAQDTFYIKVDETNRAEFEAKGLQDGLTIEDLAWDDDKLPKPQREDGIAYEAKGLHMMKPWKRGEWEIKSPTHLRLTWKNFEPRTEENRRGFTVARKSDFNPALHSSDGDPLDGIWRLLFGRPAPCARARRKLRSGTRTCRR